MVISISDQAYQKIIETTFSSPEFVPVCKISAYSIYSFLRYNQFQSHVTRLAMPIFDHVHPKTFWSTFSLCELVSTCKKIRLFYWFVLEIWLVKKTLQSDWLRTFWPISLVQNFYQIWNLCSNTANNIGFPYRKNSVKINDQIFQ